MNYLKLIPQYGLFVFLFPTKAFTFLKHTDTTIEINVRHEKTFYSTHLQRQVTLEVVLPANYINTNFAYKVLYMNDGQDLDRLNMTEAIEKTTPFIEPFILIAIHCGERIQEYGIASRPDYKQRGAKAGSYTQFVLEELMPYIQEHYRVLTGPKNTVFCGFSLSGLSAFDIVWHHPELFGKAGVFSGSFWWRQKAYENHYDDHTDRIMHQLVRNTPVGAGLASAPEELTKEIRAELTKEIRADVKPAPTDRPQFWLQTGSEDEKDDRNGNGVIDSIEDTLDLIAELERKGYRWGKDIRYVEVKDGHHDQETWSAIMPDFLKWAFGK
ncbi:alpha/beta hydrolase [Runella sp.]|uniref:alpha/beta hydrolase n=1 Tax=Runella sp. TaxID=1960881 RepID=UPI003D12516C